QSLSQIHRFLVVVPRPLLPRLTVSRTLPRSKECNEPARDVPNDVPGRSFRLLSPRARGHTPLNGLWGGPPPMFKSKAKKNAAGELLQGTLDMLILKTVARGPEHGYGIAESIQRTSDDVLRVEEGALYPALHRLELSGLLASEWGASENNRRAKFYRLTAAGRRQLVQGASYWRRISAGLARVMGAGRHEDVRDDPRGVAARQGLLEARPPRARPRGRAALPPRDARGAVRSGRPSPRGGAPGRRAPFRQRARLEGGVPRRVDVPPA